MNEAVTMRNACPTDEKLTALLLEQLTGAELRDVEAHLAQCENCQNSLDERCKLSLPQFNGVVLMSTAGFRNWNEHRAIRVTQAVCETHDFSLDDNDSPVVDAMPVIAGHAILSKIGQGGMGTVYRGIQLDLNREVAVKVVDVSSANDGQQLTRRFTHEAEITANLDHPSIVPVHTIGNDAAGRCFYTMRLVRGRELKSILELANRNSDGWNLSRAIGVMIRVCQAIAFAHTRGVVHRDLKPSNVMVGNLGEVYVLDWGLAKAVGRDEVRDLRLQIDSEEGSEAAHSTTGSADTAGSTKRPLLTIDGAIIGTPNFMPPEQATGKLDEVDERSDVYSLGAMLYQMLAGIAPYHGRQESNSPTRTLKAVIAGPPPSIDQLAEKSPPELIAICDKAMARRREDRYDSALQLAEDLEAFLDRRVVKAYQSGAFAEAKKWVLRNRGVAMAGCLALLAVIGGLSYNAWQEHRSSQRLFAAKQNVTDALNEQQRISGELERTNQQLGTINQELAVASKEAIAAKDSEQRAKLEAYKLLAESYANFGEQEAADQHFARAALWFTKAAEMSEQSPEIQHTHRMRAAQFGRSTHVPIAAYWDRDKLNEVKWLANTSAARFEFDSSSRYLLMKGRNQGQKYGEYWTQPRVIDIWNQSRQLWGNARFDAVAFSPDGQHVAVSSKPGQVEIRKLDDGQLEQTLSLDGNTQTIAVLDYSHGGALLLVGTSPARIWDVRQARFLKGEYPTGQNIVDAGFSEDDRQLLLVTNRNALRLLEIADVDGPREPTKTTEERTKLLARFTLKQRRTDAPALPDGTPVPRNLKAAFGGHGSRVAATDVDTTGRFVATFHHNGIVRIWKREQPRPYWFIKTDGWSRAVLNGDSTLIAAVGDLTQGPALLATQVYDAARECAAGPRLDIGVPILSGCFSPDNRTLALACGAGKRNRQTMFLPDGKAGTIQFWDWRAAKLIGTTIPMPSEPRSIAWHPSQNLVTVGCIRGEVVTVNPDSLESTLLVDLKAKYEEPPPWGPHGYKGGGIAFDTGGDLLFWWGFEKSWKVLDFATGRTQVTWPSEQSLPTGMAAHNGLVVVSNHNNRARMYDVTTGAYRGNAVRDGGNVAHLSRCGRYVVSTADIAQSITVWDIQQRRSTCGEFGIGGTDAHFIDNTPFVLSTTGNAIHVWDRLTGRAVAPPLQIPGCQFLGVIRVAVDGKFAVLTCSPYGLLVLDLQSFHTDPLQGLSPADGLLLAEINSCASIREGRLMDLPDSYDVRRVNNGWIYRWDDFKSRHPDFHRREIPLELAIRDHQTRAAEFEMLKDNVAADFHRRVAEQMLAE